MKCRGVRGATTADQNTREQILSRTRELFAKMIDLNDIDPEDVGSVYFTTTRDLTAEYPALAVRQMGWYDHAFLCGHEMQVPDGLERCIRILIHWNTTKSLTEIQHVYMNGAEILRPEHALGESPISGSQE